MMKLYRHANWLLFRQEVIKLDGGRCVRCARGPEDGAVLQVHHKAYVPGRAPWDYPYRECETLCKGCHAGEHGLIMPQSGWSHLGTDDLEDISGNCELCGNKIRYVYAIGHPTWGAMAVGTDCCDRLTGTTDSSEFHDRRISQCEKRKRFVDSPRWKPDGNDALAITRAGIEVRISSDDGTFQLTIDGIRGRASYPTILDAKMKAFEFIESGDAAAFLATRLVRRSRERGQGPPSEAGPAVIGP